MRAETKMKAAIVAMALLVLASVAFSVANAQTARTATITFTRPLQYTDGTDIAAGTALSYNVYQGAKGGAKTKVATITATATTINTGLPPGETCWEVTTLANGVESARSNEACKSFAFPTPEAITITVT